jgi:hypothetical protein
MSQPDHDDERHGAYDCRANVARVVVACNPEAPQPSSFLLVIKDAVKKTHVVRRRTSKFDLQRPGSFSAASAHDEHSCAANLTLTHLAKQERKTLKQSRTP